MRWLLTFLRVTFKIVLSTVSIINKINTDQKSASIRPSKAKSAFYQKSTSNYNTIKEIGITIITIQECYNHKCLHAIQQLRHDVSIDKGLLLSGMTSRDQPFGDPYDEQARHWFLSEENRVVAAARLSKHAILDDIPDKDFIPIETIRHYSGPFASMNRIVVHPDWRGRGISVLFDRIRLQAAFDMQCHTIIVCTFEKRSLDLINLGFQRVVKFDFSFRKSYPPYDLIKEPRYLLVYQCH